MNDFSSMTFTITKIEQEKCIDGVTTIYFVPNDGEKYISDFHITVVLQHNSSDKIALRELMLVSYKEYKRQENYYTIRVGDII